MPGTIISKAIFLHYAQKVAFFFVFPLDGQSK